MKFSFFIFLFVCELGLSQTIGTIASVNCLSEKQRTEYAKRLEMLFEQTIESPEMQRRRETHRAALLAWRDALSALAPCLESSKGQEPPRCVAAGETFEAAASQLQQAQALLSSDDSDDRLVRGHIKLRAEYPTCP